MGARAGSRGRLRRRLCRWAHPRRRRSVQFLEAVYEAASNAPAYGSLYSRLASKWMDFQQSNSLRGSRHNIHRHYDLGNDFYKLWLDSATALHLRIFPYALHHARRSPDRQDGLRLPQAPAPARRDGGGSRLRLGRVVASHGAANTASPSKPTTSRTSRSLFARERARKEGLSQRSSSSKTTTATSPENSMSSCRWECWSMSEWITIEAWAASSIG